MGSKDVIKELEFLKIAALFEAKPVNINVEALDYAIKAVKMTECQTLKDECASCSLCWITAEEHGFKIREDN